MRRLYMLTIALLVFMEFKQAVLHDTKTTEMQYKPEWDSLDARPLPEWYDDAKFGIFLHWGVYAVPSYGSEWFWYNWKGGDQNIENFMSKNYPPGFSYQQFAPKFKAEFFEPDKWAELFYNAGAKYVVLTSKHHEGFTLWPSSRAFSWNAMDVGPHRDLVGELSEAVRKSGIHFGLYYSLYEWFNPIYNNDRNSNYTNQKYVYEKFLPEVTELINNYKPDVLWADGDWEATDQYWRSKEFLAWLFNKSPVKDTIIVNDRWGKGISCHHGGVYTCSERFNPGVLQSHKWENCMTVDKKSWGYRRNVAIEEIMEIEDLIKELVTTVSCGGNLLMNVGPTREGTIIPIFQYRLKQMGQWLAVNGQAIYKTTHWIYQNDAINSDVWYTQSKQMEDDCPNVYAIVLKWPKDNLLHLGSLVGVLSSAKTKIYMIGNEESPLKWTASDKEVCVHLPLMSELTLKWAWTIKIVHVKNYNKKI